MRQAEAGWGSVEHGLGSEGGGLPGDTAFEVDNVSKAFVVDRGVLWALRDISLTVSHNEFVCIVGPSGCGKSTLLRILGGLIEPTAGIVKRRSSRSSFVFQEYGVFPWMNVLDNATFAARMMGVRKGERLAEARRWLERVGLTGFEHAYPHQLSGGMLQRVSLARAFTAGTDVLLMDEPLGALDAQTRYLMQELLIDLWEQERKTVVFVTHSIDEAILLSDRVVVMGGTGIIRKILEPPFPRPRSPGIERDARFGELRFAIWESLRDDVMRADRVRQ